MKNYKLVKICYYLICFCVLLVLVGWFIREFYLPIPPVLAVRGRTLNACKEIAKGLEDFFDISSGESVSLTDQKTAEFIYYMGKRGPVGSQLTPDLPNNWSHSVFDCYIYLLRDWPQTDAPTLIGYAIPIAYSKVPRGNKKSEFYSFVVTFTLTNSSIVVELRDRHLKDIYDVNKMKQMDQVIYYLKRYFDAQFFNEFEKNHPSRK